ncbi:FkbM family methyltransferase, partial [Okeania sp. SIO2C2]|uniref:FkbM family methyltransferase n=1 Tax=Okeania sp. SIO2C2 TaxID=2607787 RepID=UPI00257A2C07
MNQYLQNILASFYERKEQMLVQKTVKEGMTVFDIGANIGDYSILFSHLVGATGKVYSFEPTSSTFKKLLARLKECQCTNILAFQKAIFSENKLLEFNEFPDEYSSWNSIGKPKMEDPKNPTQYVPIVKSERVEAITLDNFCQEYKVKRIDYLKVDVEGAESYVFQGAANLLKGGSINLIQFEISQKMLEGINSRAKDTFNILAENGYECHGINVDGSIGDVVTDSEEFYENYVAFIRESKTMVSGSKSVLDRIIPPEIENDEFSMVIEKITREGDIKTVLEIGSSSGEGSTKSLVKGMSANPNNPTLFCIEVSQTRFKELEKRYQHQSFVKPYNVSSVDIKDIPKEQEVIDFYQNYKTGLNNYPLETVLGWFNEGNKYLRETGLIDNGIDKIKQENNVDVFDVVLIDGSQFTGSLELDQVYGAKYIMLDDIDTFKNYKNHRRLLADPNYDLVSKNLFLRHGYSIFKRNEQKIASQDLDLPIHFFTIVLNGQPFIRYHIDILFKGLPFKWHWHIIEGVAELNHDTSWCLRRGGKITDEIHKNGRSKDGTSEYLDELAAKYPENVTIYRKPEGEFWDGKREMVNAPLPNIKEECLLWQVDVDEIWTLEQICDTRKLFIKNPDKTAAFYWCWYFVGENLLIRTRNCYAQNPQREWLRTWRFKPGYVWASHSPPILVENLPDGKQKNIAAINPFMHAETEKEGLIFQHFAYVTPEQLSFKQQYYGYKNAVSQWQSLQSQTKFPVYLRDYFAWVKDNTMVDRPKTLGIVPLVQKNVTAGSWKFLEAAYLQKPVKLEKRSPTIIIDGIFFQLSRTGIARVWRSVLGEWAKTEFAQHIIVLDRVNTSPKIPGIRYRQIPAYNYNNTDADKQMLQKVCDEEGADLFISTYYTTPISTPSVFMAYDMIPEALETDLNKAMWREKHYAISHAFSYISISENTARDLVKFFPDITPDEVSVAHCGVAPNFTPATTTEINGFKYKYGISKPYFLLVGAGSNYKNAILFFRAFAQLYSKQGFEIVCTGSGLNFANEYREYAAGSVLHSLILSDEELKIAYSGAVALVYPSLYEGFGMPVAEALACGCPVITCANSSIPEVAGEAAIYIDANDVDGLTDALCEVQKSKVRNSLIVAGLEQVKQFSWGKMADIMSAALMKASLQRLNLREINLIIFPDWSQSEETVGLELQEVIKSLVTHKDKAKMTLLIDNSNISAEDADLILSSVAMNLLMESELEVDEGPEIVLVGELSQIQWSALIPQLQGRIKLEHENEEALTQVKADTIKLIELDSLKTLNSEKWLTKPTSNLILPEHLFRNPVIAKNTTKVKAILEAISRKEKNILELGSGNQKRPVNWITLDYYGYPCDLNHDLKYPLPFPDDSIPNVYSSHVLEHFYYYELMGLLQEIYRVLMPGGNCLICVPNAEIYIRGYLEPDKFDSEFYCKFKPGYNYYSPIDYLNYIAYMGGHHKILFDTENLKLILESIGFKNVRTRSFDSVYDLKEREHESIYFYSEKPLGRVDYLLEFLRDINLIIFPDWLQPEETVGLELQEVIKSLVTHPEKAKMTLLIDNSNIAAEDADLILSSVAMNLLMESELEVDEGPEIVLVEELSQIQWSA